MRENEIQIGVGSALWWAAFGGAIFTVGLLLILLAYSTQQIIPTVPKNYVGTFPYVSTEAFNIGLVTAGVGFIFLVYSKYRLAKLGIMKRSLMGRD